MGGGKINNEILSRQIMLAWGCLMGGICKGGYIMKKNNKRAGKFLNVIIIVSMIKFFLLTVFFDFCFLLFNIWRVYKWCKANYYSCFVIFVCYFFKL